MKVIICTWRIREWELQILNWSSSVQPEIVPLFTISFQCLKKKFKSWQVYDWLAKWLIMSGYMDLRRPRVYRRSNVGLVVVYSCKSSNSAAPGCTPVTNGLPSDIKFDIDTDRELEKIHSLFFQNIEKLENIQGGYQTICAVMKGNVCVPSSL